MTFTTLTFLIFLPVVFSAYWLLKDHRRQNVLLLVASYFFYGWWDYRFCFLMLGSSLADYGFGLWIERCRTTKARRAVLTASIFANLGVLGYFKYFNFFAESLSNALGMLGWRLDAVTVNVILPVGISLGAGQKSEV